MCPCLNLGHDVMCLPAHSPLPPGLCPCPGSAAGWGQGLACLPWLPGCSAVCRVVQPCQVCRGARHRWWHPGGPRTRGSRARVLARRLPVPDVLTQRAEGPWGLCVSHTQRAEGLWGPCVSHTHTGQRAPGDRVSLTYDTQGRGPVRSTPMGLWGLSHTLTGWRPVGTCVCVCV